jgi:hypothetical protein
MGAIFYGVSVNTHKEIDLEVLMTLAPFMNEGVSCLLFHHEDEEQLLDILENYSVTRRKPGAS